LYYWKINKTDSVSNKRIHNRVGFATLNLSGDSKECKINEIKNVNGVYHYSHPKEPVNVFGIGEVLSDDTFAMRIQSIQNNKKVWTQINIAQPTGGLAKSKLLIGTYSTSGRDGEASSGKIVLCRTTFEKQQEVLKKYNTIKNDETADVTLIDSWIEWIEKKEPQEDLRIKDEIFYYLHNQRWEVGKNYSDLAFKGECQFIERISGHYHGYFFNTKISEIVIYKCHVLSNGKVIITFDGNEVMVGFIQFASIGGVIIQFDYQTGVNYYRFQLSLRFPKDKIEGGFVFGVYSGLHSNNTSPMSGKVVWEYKGDKEIDISLKHRNFKKEANPIVINYLAGNFKYENLQDFVKFTDEDSASVYFSDYFKES
jgi:hypothetical protein